ncbi:innate immunity activator protein-like [Manacus vitellinus]|uniref:innate immunity activator protein-like n=1 Tax=Manacus vitellinus TaxID=328815 RepID=UPI00115CA069|nr:innate immunity activator protein-like [Manacus vitellinus]
MSPLSVPVVFPFSVPAVSPLSVPVLSQELTGTLPREYPLKAGEKPPKVRRRIGAAFKLDEIVVLHGVDPLERERALQLRIAEASRRLCHEQNIGRRLRKRRQTAALREEQKLRDLEQVLSQRRLLTGHRDTGTAHDNPQNTIPGECTPIPYPY